MSEINNLKPISTLKPFARFCCTIGNLPSSYMESMTYEEQLLWFCDYLKNTVIPAVNNNAEALAELQNFFANLDVQDEINNKLDEMAESGELEELISHYLQLAGLLCFNTVNDMKNATNLIDGSFAKTFGKNTYNDGEGQFYKIREIVNTDEVDGVNLIALNNFNNLVAELMQNKDIQDLKDDINTLDNRFLTEMVVIGDSYSSRTYLSSQYELWCERVAKILNLNLRNYADPGAGFLADGDERQSTFSSQINEAYNDDNFQNSKVKYVFIYGGTNDLRYYPTSNVKSVYINAYNSTLENARTKFPKAKIIYLGCDTFQNMNSKEMEDTENITELWIDNQIKNSINFTEYEISCIDLTFFYLGMSNFFNDGLYGHPNYIGHRQFANAVLNGLNSSSNAFNHLITSTPQIEDSSSAIWSNNNTLSNQNQWQLRLSDKGVKFYLGTSLTRNATSNDVLIKLPFNIRLPYSSANSNLFSQPYKFAGVLAFENSHNTAGIIAQDNVMMEIRFGYNNLRMYPSWKNSNATIYDLLFDFNINI